MGAGRKTETIVLQKRPSPQWHPNNNPPTARNLGKNRLAGVIFGCKHSTYKECIFKQLFGLPAGHFQYVQYVTQGMPLFLFNYSDRKLHGIFEAISAGQMEINQFAWTTDSQEKTPFPAQVRVKIRMQCQPLTEDQYQPILADNYSPHEPNHFWFELDKSQTEELISIFSACPVRQSASTLHPAAKWGTLFRQSYAAATHQDCSKADSQLRSTCNFIGNDRGKKKLEAPPGEDAPEIVNVTSSCQGKSWSSLFKPGPAEELKAAGTGRDVHDQDLRVPYSEVAGFSGTANVITTQTENSDKFAVVADVFNDEQDTKTAALDEDCSHESNMEWASSFPHLDGLIELVEEPWDATICEEEHVTPKPCSEGSNISAMSGIPDLEDNAAHFTPVLNEANAEATLFSDVMMSEMNSLDFQTILTKLIQTIGEMKSFQCTQALKIQTLEQELVESNRKIVELKYNWGTYGLPMSSLSLGCVKETDSKKYFEEFTDSIFIVGGFNGSSWLPTLECYSPYKDSMRSLKSMTSVRSYASSVIFGDGLYVLGGGYGTSWYSTVESYNLKSHQWVSCPSLNRKKGSLAAACLSEKIFAIGGGNTTDCFSEVEMLDLNLGKWILTRSMGSKRFASAAVVMDGVLYVGGGYDGQEYLKSMERLDPREYSWTPLKSMSTPRGCHSFTVLNEKLYAIGGYDGSQMVPTVEVFEPRVGSWMMSEPMKYARGYMGAVTLGNRIFALGGIQENEEILDTVECYSEGEGWRLMDLKCMEKRCFFSAVVV